MAASKSRIVLYVAIALAAAQGIAFMFEQPSNGKLGKIYSFTGLNLGQGSNALPSTAHLNITNAPPTALASSRTNVIFIPSSLVPSLPALEVSRIRERLSAGSIVISWADGKTNVSLSGLYDALGYSAPHGYESNPPVFAVGLMLRNGQPEAFTFASNGSVTSPINLLGVQSIWAGLNSIKKTPLNLLGRGGRLANNP